VQALAVKQGLLTADRTSAGIVNPVTQSQVATQVAGVVSKVLRSVGDWVKEGDVVVQLDDSQLKLSLATAEAAYENAKINLAMGQDNSSQASPKLQLQLKSAQSAYDSAKKYYDGQKALFDLGGIAASALDTAASQLATAQANLEGAKTALDQNGKADDWSIAQLKLALTQSQNQLEQGRLNLRNASIKAPFAGQISAISLQPGMYASLNTAVFTLVSSQKQVSFSVAPTDSPSLAVGTQLKFSASGQEYPIAVRQSPSAPISGVVPMVASAPAAALPYGSVGDVVYRIPLARGILLPIAALETLQGQNYVFVVENGRAATKNVTVVAESGTTAAVQGLAAGDVVIVSPPPGLIQGSQVQPTMIQDSAGQGNQPRQPAAGAAAKGSGQGAGAGTWQGQGSGSGTWQGRGTRSASGSQTSGSQSGASSSTAAQANP
jgi:Multidrug resistance efflux pump